MSAAQRTIRVPFSRICTKVLTKGEKKIQGVFKELWRTKFKNSPAKRPFLVILQKNSCKLVKVQNSRTLFKDLQNSRYFSWTIKDRKNPVVPSKCQSQAWRKKEGNANDLFYHIVSINYNQLTKLHDCRILMMPDPRQTKGGGRRQTSWRPQGVVNHSEAYLHLVHLSQ